MANTGKVDIDGFVKVSKDYAGRIWYVTLWNPETNETKTVACEDTDYNDPDMGLVSSEYDYKTRMWMLLHMPWFGGSLKLKEQYEAWRYQKNVENNHIMVGMTVKVVRGRKYPIGTVGVVEGFSSFCDRYGREQTRYVVTTDGKRIPMQNCRAIA